MPIYSYKNTEGNRFFYVKTNISGKQYCRRGFETKQAALMYEASLYSKAPDDLGKSQQNYSIKELMPLFWRLVGLKVRENTVSKKKSVFYNHIMPFFGDYKLKQINDTVLSVFSDKINRKKYKKKADIFALLTEFLDFLKNYGLPQLNYSLLIAQKQAFFEPIKYDYYAQDEFNHFVSVIESPRDRLIFNLLFYYGLRISELLGLRHCDFNLKDKRVFVRGAVSVKTGTSGQKRVATKSRSSMRDYPLINYIEELYIEYVKKLESPPPKDGYVFKGKRALTIGETEVHRVQSLYEKLSNMRHIKIHEFRHSCATVLINNGFDPQQVAAWLGHSSSNVTMATYAHLFPSRKNAIATFYEKLTPK